MYMVDKEKEVVDTFGYTNQDGDIESVCVTMKKKDL